MKVVSKLVNLELHIGRIERRGKVLLVHSDPERSMPTTIHIAPGDVVEILKVMLKSPGLWQFLLLMPWFGFVSEKPGKVESTTDSNPQPSSGPQKWDPWD
jgi:hypothetical protein